MVKPLLLTVLVLGSLGAGPVTPRHSAVVRAFRIATGYPHGRPGYVIDHRIPLCLGGVDGPPNLQWQAIADAKAKDVEEKRLCAQLRVFLKRWPVA